MLQQAFIFFSNSLAASKSSSSPYQAIVNFFVNQAICSILTSEKALQYITAFADALGNLASL